MFFRSYEHGHKLLYRPCIFAKDPASFPFPWVLQMSHRKHTRNQRSSQGRGELRKSTMAVFVYLLMQGISQWNCIALFLPSSHFHCLLCRNGTYRNLWSTYIFKRIIQLKHDLAVDMLGFQENVGINKEKTIRCHGVFAIDVTKMPLSHQKNLMVTS